MNEAAALPRAQAAEVFAELARGLSVVSLAKSYDRKRVLKDVSLHVDRGARRQAERLHLIGASG